MLPPGSSGTLGSLGLDPGTENGSTMYSSPPGPRLPPLVMAVISGGVLMPSSGLSFLGWGCSEALRERRRLNKSIPTPPTSKPTTMPPRAAPITSPKLDDFPLPSPLVPGINKIDLFAKENETHV